MALIFVHSPFGLIGLHFRKKMDWLTQGHRVGAAGEDGGKNESATIMLLLCGRGCAMRTVASLLRASTHRCSR